MAINIGVIGLGGIAQGVHLPGIERSKDLQLAAICDIDQKKLDEMGEKYHIDKARRFTHYQDLLACKDIEAVSICTPNDCHFQIAMDAVTAKKNYAVEKPVTLSAKDTETLEKHTHSMGVKNMVCFSYRFKTAARYARELVQTGALGNIYHVYIQYLQSWGLPDVQCPLVWRFVKERTGSGALGDLGCHAIDLVRFVTGKNYTKIIADADTYVKERKLPDGSGMGISDVDDYCHYLARMDGGISASFLISRFGFGRGNYQRMEIYGSEGALVYKLDETPDKDELEICIGQPVGNLHAFTAIPVPSRFASDQMQSFADIINGKEDGKAATIGDGLENQKVLDAVINSFEKETWIKL